MLMFLTTVTEVDPAQTVIQFIPDEYKGYVMTAIGIVSAAIVTYTTIIAPLMSKIGFNKTADKLSGMIPTDEQIGNIVDGGIAKYEKSRLQSELTNWRFKLAYATDETRPLIQAEIQRIENELAKYV